MDINNFTDKTIRLGEFPNSIDVSNIDNYHSNYGIVARFCTYRTPADGKGSFVQLRRHKNNNGFWYELVLAKWGEQEEVLEPADIIWDSRLETKNEKI